METPVFVKIDQYKQLTQILAAIDQKINESEKLLQQLAKLSEDEEAQLKAWATSLEEVKARSEELNRAFFAK